MTTDLHNLAVAVRALGHTNEAGMLLRRALEATVATLGTDHRDAAVIRSRLAEWRGLSRRARGRGLTRDSQIGLDICRPIGV